MKPLHLSVCVIHYLWYSELKLLRADPTDLQMVKIGKLAKAESRWGRMQSKSTNCAFLLFLHVHRVVYQDGFYGAEIYVSTVDFSSR